jgi:threonine dehydrogenase-like Zn-dependent dehydrogenase
VEPIGNGAINPGKVLDLDLPPAKAAEGCTAMDERPAVKTILRP